MSVSDSDYGSVSSCSYNSICEEIGTLITQLSDIHCHHHNALETLEKIHSLIAEAKNIYICYEGEKRDLDDILEKLHSESLERIKRGERPEFGRRLLSIISISQ